VISHWLENTETVVQQLVSDPVHPGDSVTLQCTVDSETCAGEHSVYWFRHGSGESLPGLIYTHGNRSDECEKSPEAGSPTHGCVYSLPKRNLSRSDAGIYYCAVVICGDILFGNGTQLDIEDAEMKILVWFSIIRITALLCVFLTLILLYKFFPALLGFIFPKDQAVMESIYSLLLVPAVIFQKICFIIINVTITLAT
uniref:Ig-like domain-containing protein n=1 Tax=Scleropages formosus TaxID=113540 RepID=A0A8C9UYA1_SCLFO